tara:strand:- start:912 stop:1595 length:684 start_codon:yes stop_codon:yes gene_type:complete
MKLLTGKIIPIIALGLLFAGHYIGLFIAPTERMMGDVYRIIYTHVPAAWICLIAYTLTFFASVYYLFRNKMGADIFAEASAEIGVMFNAILLITGSIWGKPTWGVWWTWDPRLTTAAIMFFAFIGYLALRRFINDPERRATWGSVVAILAFIDLPLVWYSVKWWNSLHQLQSTPQTVDAAMVTPLRISAFAFLFLYIWMVQVRYQIGVKRLEQEQALPNPIAQGEQS